MKGKRNEVGNEGRGMECEVKGGGGNEVGGEGETKKLRGESERNEKADEN